MSPASRTISARTAAYSRSAAARIRSGVSAVGPHRVAHLPREEVARRAGPRRRSRAGRRRAGAPRTRRAPAARRPAAACSRGVDRGDRRVVGGAVGLGERVVDELGHAGELVDRRLRVEPRDRATVDADERGPRAVEHRRDPLEPTGDRRQPVGERREVAGDEREQARRRGGRPSSSGSQASSRSSVSAKREASSSPRSEVAVDRLVRRQVARAPRARAASGPRTRGARAGRPRSRRATSRRTGGRRCRSRRPGPGGSTRRGTARTRRRTRSRPVDAHRLEVVARSPSRGSVARRRG